MSEPVFVVLRAQSETVETIGPAGQAFTSFKDADAFAKQMRNRYSQQTFYVCQAVAVYETQGRAMVKKIALPRSEKKTPKRVPAKGSAVDDPNPPNVVRMPARASSGN